jgi:hypothetical protein
MLEKENPSLMIQDVDLPNRQELLMHPNYQSERPMYESY